MDRSLRFQQVPINAPAEYSADRRRVLKGRVVIAWLHPSKLGFRVVAVSGARIGFADNPAQAMLMAIRHEEAPRC